MLADYILYSGSSAEAIYNCHDAFTPTDGFHYGTQEYIEQKAMFENAWLTPITFQIMPDQGMYYDQMYQYDPTRDAQLDAFEYFKSRGGIQAHYCQYCNRFFTQKGNLKKHLRQHTQPNVVDRKRFVWKFCNKGYTERYNLNVGLTSIIIL